MILVDERLYRIKTSKIPRLKLDIFNDRLTKKTRTKKTSIFKREHCESIIEKE